MQPLDWVSLGLFFAVLIGIGAFSVLSVKQSKDFFVGGGKLPWQIGGISHHVGGYSAVVFTAYTMYCYRDGFSMFVWWAVGFSLACFVGAIFIAPKWCKLRKNLSVQSPTEYLAIRYNTPTQQIIVWSGVLLKLLDLAGKTLAMALILYGFADVPVVYGVLITGGVGLIYTVLGGFMASARNDTFQFLVQLTGGLLMFFYVLFALQNQYHVNYFSMWEKLDPKKLGLLSDECNLFFMFGFWLALFFSANGGNWGAGLRFMAAPDGKRARKSALLSASLYLIWPLVLFAPMWAAPLFHPGLNTDEMKMVYTIMAKEFLPAGLVGIVLASMFAASISTIAGDCNAVAGVIARDIAPQFTNKLTDENGQTPLWFARTVSFVFTAVTIVIALNSGFFGGIVGLVIKWFSGLIAPISVPLVFGLFYCFRKCGPAAAISSALVGMGTFFFLEYGAPMLLYSGTPTTMGAILFYPAFVSVVVFCGFALILPQQPKENVEMLLKQLNTSDSQTVE